MIVEWIVVNKMIAKYETERFNMSNCSLWKIRMKAILKKYNCLAAIGDRPIEMIDTAKWNEIDGSAITNIYLALVNDVLSSMA